VNNPFYYQGAQLTLSELKPDEKAVFNRDFNGLLGTDDSVERKLFMDRKNFFEVAVMAIKNSLKDPTFEGIYPSDSGLGMCIIRPIQVGSTANPPIGKTNWTETVAVADTYQAWIGNTVNNRFIVGGIAGNATAQYGGLAFIGVKSLNINPKVSEIKIWNDRNERVPVDTRDIVLGDNVNQVSVVPIPGEIFLPLGEIYAELAGDITGVDYFAPVGLCIGKGLLLKRETY
jgi:hypothetical protein